MVRIAPMVLALGVGAAYAGCAHTREAEDASSAEVAQPDAENQEGAAEAPKEEEASAQQGSSGQPGMVAGGTQDPDEIPVATSAGGLLKPGAEKAVRDKLGLKGKGGMRAALQKFQRSHDLPATGMLDHETVEQLGLDPDDVFQRAQ